MNGARSDKTINKAHTADDKAVSTTSSKALAAPNSDNTLTTSGKKTKNQPSVAERLLLVNLSQEYKIERPTENRTVRADTIGSRRASAHEETTPSIH
jgi:hypothetical protein